MKYGELGRANENEEPCNLSSSSFKVILSLLTLFNKEKLWREGGQENIH